MLGNKREQRTITDSFVDGTLLPLFYFDKYTFYLMKKHTIGSVTMENNVVTNIIPALYSSADF